MQRRLVLSACLALLAAPAFAGMIAVPSARPFAELEQRLSAAIEKHQMKLVTRA